MMGEVQTYQYWLLQRVRFPDCGAELAAGYLAYHRQAQHGVARGDLKDPPPPHPHPPYEDRTCQISFLRAARDTAFPVGGCPGRSMRRSTLRLHFLHRHVRDTVVILEQGSHPLRRCPKCDIFLNVVCSTTCTSPRKYDPGESRRV